MGPQATGQSYLALMTMAVEIVWGAWPMVSGWQEVPLALDPNRLTQLCPQPGPSGIVLIKPVSQEVLVSQCECWSCRGVSCCLGAWAPFVPSFIPSFSDLMLAVLACAPHMWSGWVRAAGRTPGLGSVLL